MPEYKDPYTSKEITLAILLSYVLVIPINQRQYAWSPEIDVLTFLMDALDSMKSGYKYPIGDFITYHSNGNTNVYDGQCRAITMLLFLTACLHHLQHSVSSDETALIPYIQKLIFIDHDPWGNVSDEIKQMKKTHGWSNYPRVKSYYEEDFIQIGNIMNGKDVDIDCALYKAYHMCRKFIREEMKVGIKEFTGFLLNETIAIEKRAASSEEAAKQMNYANNRGQRMQPYENMRNLFITAFHEDSVGMSKRLESLNAHHVWEMACLLFNKEIQIPPKNYLNTTMNKVVKKKENILRFLDYAEKASAILTKLNNTYIGRRYSDLMWNVVAPLHVHWNKKEVDEGLLYEIGKALLRRGCLGVNSIGARTPWIAAAHSVISENAVFVCPSRTEGAFEMLLPHIEPVKKAMTRDTRDFLLSMLYRKTQPLSSLNVQSKLDVEHISGKECKDGVTHKEHLGNLMFFEGPNDPIVKEFRGNRSLGKMHYIDKRKMYDKSGIVMARDVAKKYETFGDAEIVSRGHELLRSLLD